MSKSDTPTPPLLDLVGNCADSHTALVAYVVAVKAARQAVGDAMTIDDAMDILRTVLVSMQHEEGGEA